MELVRPRGAGRVGIVDDGLISHEQSDDIGELTWVREVDCVSRSVDHDKDAMVLLLSRLLVCAPDPASTGPDFRQRPALACPMQAAGPTMDIG